jgi:hypothetical protein
LISRRFSCPYSKIFFFHNTCMHTLVGHTAGSHGGGSLYKASFMENPWAALEAS